MLMLTAVCWPLWLLLMGMAYETTAVSFTSSFPNSCPQEELMMYKVIMEAHWSPKEFPKHYPEWRPPAQWSKLIGISHDKSYVMFRLGKLAGPALKAFAEMGRSDLIEQHVTQGQDGVLDIFNALPITRGVGTTDSHFFVDGNHTRVSLISKIVPSPDWFVGVDSFDLCEDGNWMDNVKIQVDPLDAGTDNGLKFTSPNWPTTPAEPIYQITSKNSGQPAHSFYYPHLQNLPRIATFTIKKIKEYNMEVPPDAHGHMPYHFMPMHNGGYKHYAADKDYMLNHYVAEEAFKERNRGMHEKMAYDKERKKGSGSTMAVMDEILKDFQKEHKRKNRKHRREEKRRQRIELQNIRPPRDCRVSEWSKWSECSTKTFGIGEQNRTRTILKEARRGGRECPVLHETTWCGSASYHLLQEDIPSGIQRPTSDVNGFRRRP